MSEAMEKIIHAPDFDVGYLGLNKMRAWLRAKWIKKRNKSPGIGHDVRDIWYPDRFRMLEIETFRGEAVGAGRNREKLLLDQPSSWSVARDESRSGSVELRSIPARVNGGQARSQHLMSNSQTSEAENSEMDSQEGTRSDIMARMSIVSGSERDGSHDEGKERIRRTLQEFGLDGSDGNSTHSLTDEKSEIGRDNGGRELDEEDISASSASGSGRNAHAVKRRRM